jgi:DNA primase
MPGIDFKQVREQIPIRQVLDLLGFVPTARAGVRLRGPCPIHGSRFARSRVFSVSLVHNRYRCFKCQSAGTQLALWAAVHNLSIHAAAIDLCQRQGIPVPWLTSQQSPRTTM